jgi:hypothetical protein
MSDDALLDRAEQLSRELNEELARSGGETTPRAVELYVAAQRALDDLGAPSDGHVGDRLARLS